MTARSFSSAVRQMLRVLVVQHARREPPSSPTECCRAMVADVDALDDAEFARKYLNGDSNGAVSRARMLKAQQTFFFETATADDRLRRVVVLFQQPKVGRENVNVATHERTIRALLGRCRGYVQACADNRLQINVVHTIGSRYRVPRSVGIQGSRLASYNVFVDTVTYWALEELQYDPTAHKDTPLHTRIPWTAELGTLLCVRDPELQLPEMVDTDPIARYFDWREGDIVRIARFQPRTSAYVPYYRRVVLSKESEDLLVV